MRERMMPLFDYCSFHPLPPPPRCMPPAPFFLPIVVVAADTKRQLALSP